MKNSKDRKVARKVRRNRIRSKIFGTPTLPRLAFFKSNTNVYAQAIDDEKGHTLAHVSSLKKSSKGVARSKEVGELMGDLLLKLNIKKVVLDRGGFMYTGNVKAFAESVRGKGIKF